MEGNVIKAILYNKDGTVDYVIDNEKLYGETVTEEELKNVLNDLNERF